MALRRLLWALFAILVGITTTGLIVQDAQATNAYGYDVPTMARVGVHAIGTGEASPAQLSDLPEGSASHSAEVRCTSTTPLLVVNATNPAAEAAGWQGKGAYRGVDAWENVTLAKGTRVHAGEPGVSGFFASDSAAASVGHDATALNQGLQIAPRNGAFRPGLTEFELTSDVTVGRSIASANPQFGPGGLEQFYIPNWQDVTSPIVSRLMK